MIEKGFWQSLKRYLRTQRHQDWNFVKMTDAYNAGLPDVLYRIDEVIGVFEMKYVPQWPKRKTTKIKFKATANQIQHLRRWYGKNGKGKAFGLLGVDRNWFLFDIPVVQVCYEKGFTKEELYETALVLGKIGGKQWAPLIEGLKSRRKNK